MNARLLSMGATLALALGLVAAPAAAAGSTWYVDDDGTAGAAGCNGAITVPTSIQAAVDASGPGDTILVCPGSYPELVTIEGAAHKGLTLRATTRWAAKVNPANAEFSPIIRIASPRVTVQWLKVVAPTTTACSQASSGILIDGAAATTVLSNLVLASPAGGTLNPSAGLYEGITVNDGSTGAVVTHNIVRAFQMVGIIVHNADARVVNNSVQYWHTSSGSAVACRKAPERTSPATPSAVTGIRFYQSTGVITLNAVTNAPDGATSNQYLVDGISTEGSDSLRIRRNYVTGAYSALVLNNSDTLVVVGNVVVGTVPPQTSSASASPALVGSTGILIFGGTGSSVRDNRVAHFVYGISMGPGSTGNQMRDNDATGNGTDCQDAGGPVTAGVTLNSWISNLGNLDQPALICDDHAITPIPGSPT